MPRKPRIAPGGLAYHVMNRTWGKIDLFEDAGDYDAFERVLGEALKRQETMRLCAWCLMPNHFHLVLWPTEDGELSRFMQWLTMTHTQRWHAHRGSAGHGHLYQSRFKSFTIQHDWHFLSVCRYVERNAVRAELAAHGEQWRWCSAWARRHGAVAQAALLSPWPVAMPQDWTMLLEQPQGEAEISDMRMSLARGRPYGGAIWTRRVAVLLGAESSLRRNGRPRKRGGGA